MLGFCCPVHKLAKFFALDFSAVGVRQRFKSATPFQSVEIDALTAGQLVLTSFI